MVINRYERWNVSLQQEQTFSLILSSVFCQIILLYQNRDKWSTWLVTDLRGGMLVCNKSMAVVGGNLPNSWQIVGTMSITGKPEFT